MHNGVLCVVCNRCVHAADACDSIPAIPVYYTLHAHYGYMQGVLRIRGTNTNTNTNSTTTRSGCITVCCVLCATVVCTLRMPVIVYLLSLCTTLYMPIMGICREY